MGILETIKSRRSIRDFRDKEISQSAVDALVEAILWAPSAGNLQSRKFFFVFNKDMKKRLARAALGQNFISRAHVVVIACTDSRISSHYGDRGVSLYAIQDAAASTQNMMLTAHELGLGSVWVGAFREEEVAEILKLPDHLRPVAVIPIGHPAMIPKPPARVSRNQAVEFIR